MNEQINCTADQVLGAVIPRDICQIQIPFESDIKGVGPNAGLGRSAD